MDWGDVGYLVFGILVGIAVHAGGQIGWAYTL